MEIRLPPDQEAHLFALAARSGRSADEVVREAIILWEERENARFLAAFRTSLDDAEASVARGEGTEITQESLREFTDDIKRRGRERLAAEKRAPR
jgi:hypothetical protein